MTILMQCDKCWCRFALKHKLCPKCGVKITTLRRRFVVEVRDLNGKKHVKSLGNVSLEEARITEYKFKKEVRSEKPVIKTIREVCIAYLNKLESTDRIYIDDVNHRLSEICKCLGKDIDATKVTVQDVDAFRGNLLKRGLAKATVDRYFAAGRAAWNYSIDGVNPWKKAGMLNPDNKITRYLSDDERSRLLDACKKVSQHLYEIVYVAMGTGLRKSEILTLTRPQVDFEHGSIFVKTKGAKNRLLYPSESVMELLLHIQHNGTEYFWVDKTGVPYAKYWKYSWKKALKIANIDVEFRFHDLRHDAATRAYSATNDIYLVSQMLGHSEISVTTRYAHLEKKKIKRVFSTIDPSNMDGTREGNNDTKA